MLLFEQGALFIVGIAFMIVGGLMVYGIGPSKARAAGFLLFVFSAALVYWTFHLPTSVCAKAAALQF